MANEGAIAYATDIDMAGLSSLETELDDYTAGRIEILRLDATDDANAALPKQTGDIDILFNVAGHVHNAQFWKRPKTTGISPSPLTSGLSFGSSRPICPP